MAKRVIERILVEEESTDTKKVYKRVWGEVPVAKPAPAKPKAKKAPAKKSK